jgi:hypothetical protein
MSRLGCGAHTGFLGMPMTFARVVTQRIGSRLSGYNAPRSFGNRQIDPVCAFNPAYMQVTI